MDAIVVKVSTAGLEARRQTALDSVRLTEEELRDRVNRGVATPDELDAFEEVDTVSFLMEPSIG